MPTYDYKCNACKHRWELFQSMSASHVKACPSCGKKKAERLIGMGAALLFKGGGFYETDYRSESYKKSAEADKKSSEPAKTEAPASGAAGATPATPAPAPAATAAVASSGSEASKPTAKKPEPSAPTKPVKKK